MNLTICSSNFKPMIIAGIKIPAIDHAILLVAFDFAGPSSAPADVSSPIATTKLNTLIIANTAQTIVMIVLEIPFAISFSFPAAKPHGARTNGIANELIANSIATALCLPNQPSTLRTEVAISFITDEETFNTLSFVLIFYFSFLHFFVKPKWLHLYYAIFLQK